MPLREFLLKQEFQRHTACFHWLGEKLARHIFFVVNPQQAFDASWLRLRLSCLRLVEQAVICEETHGVNEAVCPERMALVQVIRVQLFMKAWRRRVNRGYSYRKSPEADIRIQRCSTFLFIKIHGLFSQEHVSHGRLEKS